jgi:hypothetical protein
MRSRAAINRIRDDGQPLDVRCTWEGGFGDLTSALFLLGDRL